MAELGGVLEASLCDRCVAAPAKHRPGGTAKRVECSCRAAARDSAVKSALPLPNERLRPRFCTTFAPHLCLEGREESLSGDARRMLRSTQALLGEVGLLSPQINVDLRPLQGTQACTWRRRIRHDPLQGARRTRWWREDSRPCCTSRCLAGAAKDRRGAPLPSAAACRRFDGA